MIKKLAVLSLCMLLVPSVGFSENPFSEETDGSITFTEPTTISSEDLDTAKT